MLSLRQRQLLIAGVSTTVFGGIGILLGLPAWRAPACTVNGLPATSNTVNGTAGADTIVCTGRILADVTINGLGGDDTILIEPTLSDRNGLPINAGTVNGGPGADRIRITSVPVGSVANAGTVHGDDGDDTITITGANFDPGTTSMLFANTGSVFADSGDDNITIIGPAASTSPLGELGPGGANAGLVDGGTANTVINIAAGDGIEGGRDASTAQSAPANTGTVKDGQGPLASTMLSGGSGRAATRTTDGGTGSR
jgi:hypothetical protein